MEKIKGFTPLEVLMGCKKSGLLTGFTLIELLVVIGIIGILSSIILFSVTQYINKGKDASVAGNLAVLVPAGEVYYDNNSSSYTDFCNSSVVQNSFSQITSDNKHCLASSNAWSACARLFVNDLKAYCVDSRGIKKEINNPACVDATVCP